MSEQVFDRKQLGALFLKRFAAERAEQSAQRGAAVQAKRAAKRVAPVEPEQAAAAAEAAAVPDFSVAGKPKRRPVNTVDVERWWRAAMEATFTVRARHVAWGPRERVLAKQLLLLYGPEAVERGLAEWIAAWSDHLGVVDGRLPPLPTLQLLWAMRQEVWSADVAGVERNVAKRLAKGEKGATLSDKERLREERRLVGEYNPREKDPKKRKGTEW